jgi:hypothetical protein
VEPLTSEEAERVVVLMNCIDELHVVTRQDALTNEMCEEQAVRWMRWLEPFDIPTEDLPRCFILGNAERAKMEIPRRFEIIDVARGYFVLEKQRLNSLRDERRREMINKYSSRDIPFCELCNTTGTQIVPDEVKDGMIIRPGYARPCPKGCRQP